MSNAPAPVAPAAGGAPAPAAGAPPAPPKTDLKTVPADVRRRVLGARPPSPTDTPPAAAAPPAAPAAAAPPAEAPPPAAPPVIDPKAKVRKAPKEGPTLPAAAPPNSQADVESMVRKILPDIQRETPPAAPPAPNANPEVEREIDLARFAETKQPDRYAGFADKVKGFYQSRDELLAAKAKELGGNNSPQFKDYIESDEFRGWVDLNRPSYVRGDKAKLSEDMIADRARAEATREMQPKFKQLERQTAELQHGPAIAAKADAALRIIITDPGEVKDPALEGFAKDPMKFGEEHPEEAQVIASEAADAVELVREVYRIDRDLVDFDPKARPQQKRIRDFMVDQNRAMREKHPNGLEMADGKILIDAETFRHRGLDKDDRYRVFNSDEIAGMIAATSNGNLIEKLRKRREGVAKSIYATRKPEEPPAPSGQAAPHEDPPAPGAPSSSAPGGAKPPPKAKVSLAKRYA